jgi:putative transposase
LDFRQTGPWRGKEFAVKKKRFSVEQIVATLKQIELGMTVAAASRQLGVSERAIYRWKMV